MLELKLNLNAKLTTITMKNISAIFLAVASLTLSGCGGGDSSEENTQIVLNTPPALTGEPDNAFVGKMFEFKPTVSDKDNDLVSISANNLPSWLTLSNNILTGTPAVTDLGSVTFELIASDGKGSSTYTYSLQVIDSQETNTAPVVSGQIPSAYTGKAFSFTPTIYDKENDVLTFTIENAPTWSEFDLQTARLSGTPSVQDVGTHRNVVLNVNDGVNQVAFNFDIKVQSNTGVNTPPSIKVSDQTAIVDSAFSYTPIISDAQNDTLAMAINNAPSWLSFDNVTGETTGTPEISDLGVYKDIKITISDGEYSVSGMFDITVSDNSEPNTAPEISGTPPNAYENKAYTFVLSVTDKENDTLSFEVNNLPTWLSFDESNTTFSGTPSGDNVGQHNNINLTVSDGKLQSKLTFSITVLATEPTNTAPVISGTPTTAQANYPYSFIPTASDADGDTLRFSVSNLPSWAAFNTITGEIYGTPHDQSVGTYNDIVITVNDGKDTASLTVSITVDAAPITNNPPIISGTPSNAQANATYSFIPTASDADGDSLRFSVSNLPSWAAFNTITGEVYGTPHEQNVGTYNNIVITVNDGKDTASMTVSITVDAAPITNNPPEISGTPNNAVVNTAYEFIPTTKDSDGDSLNFSVKNLPNWLSFDNKTGRLFGTPTKDNVATYSNIAISVSDGKAEATLTIEITVEAINNLPVLLTTTAKTRAAEPFSLALNVKDDDNDTITITPVNLPTWLSFNQNTKTLTGSANDDSVGSQQLTFSLSDGKESNTQSLTLEVEKSWLTIAIETGNALVVKESETILNAASNELSSHQARFNTIKSQLFKQNEQGSVLTAIDWDPTHDAAILQGQYPFNDTVLYTTNSNQSGGPDRILPIAIAGSKTENTGRYLAYGGNPFRNTVNDQMLTFMTNAFDWLTQTSTTTKSQFNVVLTQLDESYWFRDRSLTRAWLDNNYSNVSYNQEGDCDGTKLAQCIAAKPDVIIISRMVRDGDDKQAVLDAVSSALEQDIPVIYIQYDGGIGDHGRKLLQLLNISHQNDNYWWKLYLDDFNPSTVFNTLPSDMVAINTLLNNFKAGNFNVDLSNCETRSCPAESNTQSEFFAGADAVKAMFNRFDSEKRNIFTSADYRLNKLLILLADHYRQTVSFPMDKTATDTTSFFKSLYADYAVYNVRDINPIQPDMGNFSRSDFSHITPEHASVTLTAKPYFRSAGVYAIPGQSFTVTRTDTQDVSTHVFINTLRTGATHIFNENKYNRPYLLQTQKIEVKPNESITLTSSYGGPIQIAFNKKDVDVSFSFTHIGRHPHWRNKADDAIFAERMASGDYDWAEIATPGFEVHSKLTKLETSLAGSIWPVASDFANATSRYTHNLVHVLAGFKGPGIDVEPEIHDFVTARGLDVDTIDIVKHMNADQPTCGWGCSGNPYDAGWNFSPTGHGDLHELGHGIERGSMRFEGYGGHSNTNFYSYFSKSVYEDETGESASCQSLPFKELFNTLQQSKLDADPVAYMQANLTKSWSEHHAIYMQLMMAAQAHNTLNNGWFVYPRLHIWEREFYRADDSDSAWESKKVGLGFANYTRAEVASIARNDWLYISLSHITQLDLTKWFTMYGFTVSDKAQTQVKSNGFNELAEVFYTSDGTGYCSSLNQTELPVDGTQTWPHN